MLEVDSSDEELLKVLESKNPTYLADVYRNKGHIENCIDLLKKIYKKEQLTEQICLSHIYVKNYEAAEKIVSNSESSSKNIQKLKLTLELIKNVKDIEIEDIKLCNYLSIQNKLFEEMSRDISIVRYIPVWPKLKESSIRLDKNKSIYKVYDYKCDSEEYQHILSSILEYLLKYFDLDLILIYYEIVNVSCYLSHCTSNCRERGHETIRSELLDPTYINVLGYRNLCALYEMYKDKALLEVMYRMNPFIDEKYKNLYLKGKEPPTKEFVVSHYDLNPIEEKVLISKVNEANGIAEMMHESEGVRRLEKQIEIDRKEEYHKIKKVKKT